MWINPPVEEMSRIVCLWFPHWFPSFFPQLQVLSLPNELEVFSFFPARKRARAFTSSAVMKYRIRFWNSYHTPSCFISSFSPSLPQNPCEFSVGAFRNIPKRAGCSRWQAARHDDVVMCFHLVSGCLTWQHIRAEWPAPRLFMRM